MSLLPRRVIRGRDVVWLLLFTALALLSSNPTPLVLCLGAFQIFEGQLKWFVLRREMLIAILLKLVLCYLLISSTGGIRSSYYTVLLLPLCLPLPGWKLFRPFV